jgi:hypothetical protein
VEYEHYHYDEDTDTEQHFRLVYDVESGEFCSESRTSYAHFVLEEAYRVTDDGEVELRYNEETYEFEGLPSEPTDESLHNLLESLE